MLYKCTICDPVPTSKTHGTVLIFQQQYEKRLTYFGKFWVVKKVFSLIYVHTKK